MSRPLQRLRAAVATFARRRTASVPMLVVWLAAVGGVAYLSRGGLASSAIAKGYAEPENYAVAAVHPGRLARLEVALGQPVKAGDVVAALDPREAEAEVARLRSALAQAKARVAAERDVVEAEVARGEIWVVKARAGEQEDRARLKEVEAQVARLEALAGEQLVTASALEEARQRRAALQSRVQIYERAIKLDPPGKAEPQRSFLSAQERTSSASVTMRLAPFEEQVHQVEAELAGAELLLEATTLRAPVDGVVAQTLRRPGEVLAAGAEVLTVTALPRGRVTAWVHEKLAAEVSVGQGVSVQRVGALWGRLAGHIAELSPRVEEMPERLRAAPHIPVWGRKLVVQLDAPAELLPGEAFDVRL